MTNSPQILLLCSSLPGTIGVGGILLEEMSGTCGKDTIFAFVANSFGENFRETKADNLFAYELHEACSWALPIGRFGRIGKFFRWVRLAIKNELSVRNLVKAACAYAKRNDIQKIWVVLETPITIAMARRVTDKLNKPCHVMVWDDVEQLIPLFRVNKLSAVTIRKKFALAIRNSDKCAVIGESMKEEYDRKYGVDSIIVRHGIEPGLLVHPAKAPVSEGPIKIGFTGSVSAVSAFNAFIEALDRAEWKIGGREVTVQLTGLRFVLGSRFPTRIEYLGWRSVKECVALLGQCDVNYLPQPFEPSLGALAKLSFPTKFTTYLAAGRPILLHCPAQSSLQKFNEEFPVAKWCGSLSPESILADLSELVCDQQLRSSLGQAAQIALRENFSPDVFANSFTRFLDLQ
jgi:hypothetical protein